MKVQNHVMVPLGYGKYFRSDAIIGLEPIEEGRGHGRRTKVFIEGVNEPIIASRTESTILRDMVEAPEEITEAREYVEMLKDILESIKDVPPLLRTIIKQQGGWDLDKLEAQMKELLEIE